MDASCASSAAGEGGDDRAPPPSSGGEPPDDVIFGRLPLTDLGNAERFAGRYKAKLRYCPALGWLAWDGRRWSREGADEMVKLAEHATARAIQDEAEALETTPGADLCLKEATHYVRGDKAGEEKTPPVFLSGRLRAWGRESEGAQRLAAMSKRACAMLAIETAALDRDPLKINVENGTLRISRDVADGYVELRAHDPADYITRLAPVTYDPQAECPLYDRFLAEIQPEAAMRRFLHAWFGYSLLGDTGEQKMAFLYGTGRNGKSVLVNAVTGVAGGYADSISIESFLDSGRARAGGQATPDLAALPGVRLLSTSEPKKGAKLDEALIKLFTGGERIKARHLNKDFFGFTPQAKLTMQGNYQPKIRDTDEGMWSRVKIVPFKVFVPKEKRDPHLQDKLEREGAGILNRLLDGIRAWLDDGHLTFPDEVDQATAQYRADCDPIGRFLEACVAAEDGAAVKAKHMHDVFAAWAKENGETVYSIKGLGGALRDRGLTHKRSDGAWWSGVKLIKDVWDFGGAAPTETAGPDAAPGWEDAGDE